MALGSLAMHLTVGGFNSLTANIKRRKLESKVESSSFEIPDLLWLAGYYLSKKKYLKAEQFGRKAFDLDSTMIESQNILFQIYFMNSDFNKAIEIIDLLVNQDSLTNKDKAIHYFNYGFCYYKLGDKPKAEEMKGIAVKIDPSVKKLKYK